MMNKMNIWQVFTAIIAITVTPDVISMYMNDTLETITLPYTLETHHEFDIPLCGGFNS